MGEKTKTEWESQILRSLESSREKVEIIMYLHKIYPNTSDSADISKHTEIDKATVLRELRGKDGRFDKSNSLLGMGLVDKIEQGDVTYYKLSERGKSVIESVKPPSIFYDWVRRHEG